MYSHCIVNHSNSKSCLSRLIVPRGESKLIRVAQNVGCSNGNKPFHGGIGLMLQKDTTVLGVSLSHEVLILAGIESPQVTWPWN